jgi:hypothetical protein
MLLGAEVIKIDHLITWIVARKAKLGQKAQEPDIKSRNYISDVYNITYYLILQFHT